MGKYLPLLLLAVIFIGLFLMTRRNRARAAAADQARLSKMHPGLAVMTTSGLYGTVVSVAEDGSAQLAVAPGVQLRWSVAALREVAELPPQYRAALPTEATNSDNSDVN